ncbi:hypothetical protein C8A00DRAFT_14394 [Chaetomidium leptoderma]|uniref:Uncharacterized protein n=1 Tax=Chaetomidium leptoderma TaxID=669021 RepID=A0AAN6ZZC0_9PEZI|nr:hypothetical protein C8A00DRAFT_14394 [Chaetomidium leptoderma]
MASETKRRGLNWLRPGRQEVAVVGGYVADQAPEIHTGFGGSSQLDVEQVKFVLNLQPYVQLEHALKEYITETLRIQVTTFDNHLCEKIGDMEKAYDGSKKGLWHRLWYGMAGQREIIGAWLDLIPDEFGLSVIKAGIAVVFKLAENSKDKRAKVFNTFSTLQEALLKLRPDCARFGADPKVKQSATELYQAIVRAIEDLVLVLSRMEKFLWTRFAARLKREYEREESRPTLDTILQTLETHIKGYHDAVDLARDHIIERTEAYSRLAAGKTTLVHQDTHYLRKRADEDAAFREEQRQQDEDYRSVVLKAMRGGETELKQVAEGQGEIQASMRTVLMNVILELKHQEAIEAEIVTLRQQLEISHSSKHTAVVSLTHLCNILAQPLSAYYNSDEPPNLEWMFQHPSNDLRHALAEQGRFPLKTQGQVQSLLTHQQFLDWLSHPHPSLILVDANIRESNYGGLSAISVFSSTLVTSLMQAYPDTAVVIHFFCGMHAARGRPLYGPSGLVRSLIMQLLMKLDAKDPDMRTWNLDFINDRAFLRNLEEHSLADLCFALHSLLYEFSVDTCVYCIVDSISCFDARGLLEDLGTVMGLLRAIVDDTKLVPVFKVLVTNPRESTRAIKNMTLSARNPAGLITLSPHNLVPGQISGLAVDDHLLRTPAHIGGGRPRSPSPFRHSRAPSPAVSVRKRIAEPVLAAREVFPDSDGGPYWTDNSDNGRWGY